MLVLLLLLLLLLPWLLLLLPLLLDRESRCRHKGQCPSDTTTIKAALSAHPVSQVAYYTMHSDAHTHTETHTHNLSSAATVVAATIAATVCFCATCKTQLKSNFTSFFQTLQTCAHKQSISRNQHQSRLKHLSQSGTRQVKAQRRLSSAPLVSGSVRFSSVAAVRLPHNSIKRKVNTANTPLCLHAPTTTSPLCLGQLQLSAQSVSQWVRRAADAAIGRGQERVFDSIHSIHSALFTIHSARTSHDAVAGSQIKWKWICLWFIAITKANQRERERGRDATQAHNTCRADEH